MDLEIDPQYTLKIQKIEYIDCETRWNVEIPNANSDFLYACMEEIKKKEKVSWLSSQSMKHIGPK